MCSHLYYFFYIFVCLWNNQMFCMCFLALVLLFCSSQLVSNFVGFKHFCHWSIYLCYVCTCMFLFLCCITSPATSALKHYCIYFFSFAWFFFFLILFIYLFYLLKKIIFSSVGSSTWLVPPYVYHVDVSLKIIL